MVIESTKILVVDDEEGMRDLLSIVFEKMRWVVYTASTGEEGLRIFDEHEIDLIVQDIRMPGMGGLAFLEKVREVDHEIPVLVITAFSSWDSAVEAMRLGANDYIRKPFSTDEITDTVKRLLEQRKRCDEGIDDSVIEKGGFVLGSNKKQREIFEYIKQIAPTDSTVLIRGESGTGKELIARIIHSCSRRATQPFIPVNCGAFPETLLESELFGYKRGAFTGAYADKKGLMELSDKGTLFLDEVAEMTPVTQVKLLRVLEERKLTPLGGTKEISFDARVIAATNKNLEKYIEEGNFREDLYFRLNVIPVHIPPLRERKEDIPLLAGHFLAKYSKNMGKLVSGISEDTKDTLLHYDWPGNVRELENIIQRHVALSKTPIIKNITIKSFQELGKKTPGNGSDETFNIPEEGIDLDACLNKVERKYIKEALRITNGNMTKAAKLLNLNYRSIRYKVKKLRGRSKINSHFEEQDSH